MRIPIVVPHTKFHWQVVWRLWPDGANWSHYVDAETDLDAIREARNLMAWDERTHPEEIGKRKRWRIVEVRRIAVPEDDGGWRKVDEVDPLYPRRLHA